MTKIYRVKMNRKGAPDFSTAVEIADRPQGEWMWHEGEDICNCSECKFEIDATGCIEPMEYVGVFRYCPNCGSKMRMVALTICQMDAFV